MGGTLIATSPPGAMERFRDIIRKMGEQFPLHSPTISFLGVTAGGTDDAGHQVTDGTRGSPELLWQSSRGGGGIEQLWLEEGACREKAAK